MSDTPEDTKLVLGQTMVSAIFPIAGVLFIVAALFAFCTVGWVVGLCGLAIAAVLFALGFILDLLLEIYKSLRRLEAKSEQKGDKK